MPYLLQFSVEWSDLVAVNASLGSATSITPVTVRKQVNLYGGRYKARISGFQVYSGHHTANHPLPSPQIINISSTKFQIPGNGEPGLSFSNTWCGDCSLAGHREFIIDSVAGGVDLTLTIQQLGDASGNPPYVNYTAGTWTNAEFGYIILSLSLEECDSKATFGNVKNAFQ
jgi:hypothetical protein